MTYKKTNKPEASTVHPLFEFELKKRSIKFRHEFKILSSRVDYALFIKDKIYPVELKSDFTNWGQPHLIEQIKRYDDEAKRHRKQLEPTQLLSPNGKYGKSFKEFFAEIDQILNDKTLKINYRINYKMNKTLDVKISDLLQNTKIMQLSGNAFKAYCVLLGESQDGVIDNFSIRGTLRDWQNTPELNLSTSKNAVKLIIRELEKIGLIETNLKLKILKIKQ